MVICQQVETSLNYFFYVYKINKNSILIDVSYFHLFKWNWIFYRVINLNKIRVNQHRFKPFSNENLIGFQEHVNFISFLEHYAAIVHLNHTKWLFKDRTQYHMLVFNAFLTDGFLGKTFKKIIRLVGGIQIQLDQHNRRTNRLLSYVSLCHNCHKAGLIGNENIGSLLKLSHLTF